VRTSIVCAAFVLHSLYTYYTACLKLRATGGWKKRETCRGGNFWPHVQIGLYAADSPAHCWHAERLAENANDTRPRVVLGAYYMFMFFFPSEHWGWWLGDRNGIEPVRHSKLVPFVPTFPHIRYSDWWRKTARGVSLTRGFTRETDWLTVTYLFTVL